MILSPEILDHPAFLLFAVGGLVTFVTSILMALDSFRGESGAKAGDAVDQYEPEGTTLPSRPRSFIFIGFITFPVFLGGFWGGGSRRRVLGVCYLAGLILAASGAVLLLLG